MHKESSVSSFIRTIRKFFVSAFVAVTFVAYVLHERVVNPNGGISTPAALAPIAMVAQHTPASPQVTSALPTPAQMVLVATPTPEALSTSTDQPQPTPTEQPLPTPTAIVRGMYKDGTYTGAETDAYYGLVQVEAVIQDGKIADVQFLEFPQDRRTSVRINSRAVPSLQTEALQAQSAQVDMISGATLTSRAFIQSLQSALNAAKA
jgi:uncharacterized protein with FMN-binding domain